MTNSLFDLSGKTCLVTGGNSGIGLGYARALARQGANIIIWGRNSEKNAAAEAELQRWNVEVTSAIVDITEEDAVKFAMQTAQTQHGRLDCVVANAGVVAFAKSMFDIDAESWQSVIDTNLNGAFYTLREGARHMIEQYKNDQRGGSLIVCGSLSAFAGHRGLEHYAATKGALAALVKTMSSELGRYQIRVNMIAPGFIETSGRDDAKSDPAIAKRTPLGRIGTPHDLAGAAAYLASDASCFHTGDVLTIDGGWMASLF